MTLDGETRELKPGMLVIADRDRALALAGVMGGADSEIGFASTDVLLESAWFDPISIRRTAKALGMHTEASHRFERGADVNAAVSCHRPDRCFDPAVGWRRNSVRGCGCLSSPNVTGLALLCAVHVFFR